MPANNPRGIIVAAEGEKSHTTATGTGTVTRDREHDQARQHGVGGTGRFAGVSGTSTISCT